MKAELTVALALCLAGCTKTRRFSVRQLIQRPSLLDPGEEVLVVYRDHDPVQAVFAGLNAGTLHTDVAPIPLTEIVGVGAERISIRKSVIRGIWIFAPLVALIMLL